MAVSMQCDICKKFYEPYNLRKSAENTNGLKFINMDPQRQYFSHGAIDCCPECMKSIKDHIESLRVKEVYEDDQT